MNWLVLLWAFELGTFQEIDIISQPSPNCMVWESPTNSFYTKMEVTAVLWDHFEIGGFMKSYQFPNDDMFFCPFRIDYGFKADIHWGPIEVGFIHECDHPVVYSMASQIGNSFGKQTSEIYLKFSSKIEF